MTRLRLWPHRASPVERYLRHLSLWAPRRCRRDLLLEAERHLYDTARRGEERGLSSREAQACAVRAFGSAWRIGLAARGIETGRYGRWVERGRTMLASMAARLARPRRRPPTYRLIRRRRG